MDLLMMYLKRNINLINNVLLFLPYAICTILFVVSFNFPYFWDGVAQVSKEGFNYYGQFNPNFHNLTVTHSPSLFPMMGLLTAALWTVFGLKLWVTHALIFLWGILLIYNVRKIVQLFFQEKYVAIITFIAFTESTVLSQLAIGGIDIIIFTSFVISLRAILDGKKWLLAIGLFFLINIYSRGLFLGIILLIVDFYFNYYKSSKKETKTFLKFFFPYLPAFIFLAVSIGIYFSNQNRVSITSSSYSTHYQLPANLWIIFKHFLEFGLRSAENGRLLIWLLSLLTGYKLFRSKHMYSKNQKILLSVLILHLLLYFLFIFISQMPFSARYFMPHFFLLTIFCCWGIIHYYKKQIVYTLLFLVILLQATGHFWIYPDKIAKSWDCTLSHIPYYELRKTCFRYIDENGINYDNISAGFCFYGDRGYAELNNFGKTVIAGRDREYFIYSNISAEDADIEEVENSNSWTEVKRFEKGKVFVVLLKRKE